MAIIVLLLLGAVVLRAMTPDERRRLVHGVRVALRRVYEYVRMELGGSRAAPSHGNERVLVAPALVALQFVVFTGLLFGGAGRNGDAALLSWGASVGPRTTNGEWWRLVTTMFVHARLLGVLINAAALLQVGFVVERAFGALTFLAAYVAAGIFAAVTDLSLRPIAVAAGGSSGTFGAYGLLITLLVRSSLCRAGEKFPHAGPNRYLPLAIAFTAYNGIARNIAAAAGCAALVVGACFGLILTGKAQSHSSPVRRVAVTSIGALSLATLLALPLHGIADVAPEIKRLADLEHRTVAVYEAAAEQLKTRAKTAAAVAAVIDDQIVPELEAADMRVGALQHVPREEQPRVGGAREYLRLRTESWRLRASGLRKTAAPINMAPAETVVAFRRRAAAEHRSTATLLGQAEGAEHEALEVLARISR